MRIDILLAHYFADPDLGFDIFVKKRGVSKIRDVLNGCTLVSGVEENLYRAYQLLLAKT